MLYPNDTSKLYATYTPTHTHLHSSPKYTQTHNLSMGVHLCSDTLMWQVPRTEVCHSLKDMMVAHINNLYKQTLMTKTQYDQWKRLKYKLQQEILQWLSVIQFQGKKAPAFNKGSKNKQQV